MSIFLSYAHSKMTERMEGFGRKVKLKHSYSVALNTLSLAFRDSEYYDYGHGEVQDSYEAYGMSLFLWWGRMCK